MEKSKTLSAPTSLARSLPYSNSSRITERAVPRSTQRWESIAFTSLQKDLLIVYRFFKKDARAASKGIGVEKEPLRCVFKQQKEGVTPPFQSLFFLCQILQRHPNGLDDKGGEGCACSADGDLDLFNDIIRETDGF